MRGYVREREGIPTCCRQKRARTRWPPSIGLWQVQLPGHGPIGRTVSGDGLCPDPLAAVCVADSNLDPVLQTRGRSNRQLKTAGRCRRRAPGWVTTWPRKSIGLPSTYTTPPGNAIFGVERPDHYTPGGNHDIIDQDQVIRITHKCRPPQRTCLGVECQHRARYPATAGLGWRNGRGRARYSDGF